MPSDQPEQVPEEVRVRINGRVHRLPYQAGFTLLETMRRQGILAPSACEQGLCGTCMVRLLQGRVRLRQNHVLSEQDLALGYTLACQGEPEGPVCEIQLQG